MAIINTLRNKSGKILVVVIVLALVAFIVGDPSTAGIFNAGPSRDIAEIDGEEITYEDFQARVNELSYVFSLNTNRNPQGDEVDRIREMAWQSFLVDFAYKPEYKAIGLEVSDTELVDMVQGNNTHPHVRQMLGNPQTGEFDRSFVTSFLQQLNSPEAAGQRESWARFESTLIPSTQMARLDALMDKTNYVTQAEAKSQHQAQNSNVTIEYVYVPYTSIPDSSYAVTDAELKDYLNENKEEFKRDEARDLSYVTFDILPSAEDSAVVINEVAELVEGLRNAQNDSSYAALNSDGQFPFMTYRPSNLPEFLFVNDEIIPAGYVTTPNTLQDRMVVYKMSRIAEGPEYNVKASHILLRWEDESDEAKAEAKKTAEEVLRKARRGDDFTALASEYSEDPSNAQRGGDLGWFGENSAMAQPFKDASFGHSGTGVIPRVVETQFGYHIIKVDEPKTNLEYKVAIIEKEFFVSNESLEDAYREASTFQASVTSAEDFKTKAEELNLDVQVQSRVTNQATRVGGITNARSIVLWLYNDASVGDVSDVFELDDKYVIAAMTGIQEEGVARVDDVRNQVTLKVRNEKKAKVIVDKLTGIQGESFTEVVSGYGAGATTNEATITLSSNSITGVGIAPEAVGTAFAMAEGETTAPFASENGVLILKLVSKSEAQETEDYSMYLQQLLNQRASRKIVATDFPLTYFRVLISQDLDNAMKEISGMEDRRYRFF